MAPADFQAKMDRKRKRISSADDGLELQLAGPVGGVAEQVASSSVAIATDLAAGRNATTGQEVPVAVSSPAQLSWALAGPSELSINQLTVEIENLKCKMFELDVRHDIIKLRIKKENDEEVKKLMKMFEEKTKQEETKFQNEQSYLRDVYEKLLRNRDMADKWAAMNRFLSGQWSLSASDSPQVPQSTMHMFPLDCGPKQSFQAAAHTAPASAMHTVQSGYYNGSVLRPHIPSTSSHHLATAPASASFRPHTSTSLPPGVTMNQPVQPSAVSAPYLNGSLSHMSATYAATTTSNIASTSTQRFAPSASTSLRHANLTIREPSQHLTWSQPHPSVPAPPVISSSSQGFRPRAGTPLWSTNQPHPSATTASTPPGFRPSVGTLLRRPAYAPGSVLRAPAPHLRSRLPVLPGTSTPGSVMSAAPESLAFRPAAGTLLSNPNPTPGPGTVHQVPVSQLAYPWPDPSAMPSTSAPAPGPVRGSVTGFVGNGMRNGNGASSSRANGNGTASETGQWMMDKNGVIYLSDDD